LDLLLKNIGEEFINYFNQSNNYSEIFIDKKYPLVKYYDELNLLNPI
jgi:hypothetical protein